MEKPWTLGKILSMYRHNEDQLEFVNFYLPFGGKLNKRNRWVRLAEMVPWEKVEKSYSEHFSGKGMGAPAKSAQIAFGALIIKERLGITDEETVEQISENPYLQYFLGLREYQQEPLFDPSMMVHFRTRFSEEQLSAINEDIVFKAMGENRDEQPEPVEPPPPSLGSEDSVQRRFRASAGKQGQTFD